MEDVGDWRFMAVLGHARNHSVLDLDRNPIRQCAVVAIYLDPSWSYGCLRTLRNTMQWSKIQRLSLGFLIFDAFRAICIAVVLIDLRCFGLRCANIILKRRSVFDFTCRPSSRAAF